MRNTVTFLVYPYFNPASEPPFVLSRGKLHLSIQGTGDFQFKTQLFGETQLIKFRIPSMGGLTFKAPRRSTALPIP